LRFFDVWVRFHQRKHTKPIPFVNAQFLAQKAGFSYDLREFLLICGT
jgi:hypothetical protein